MAKEFKDFTFCGQKLSDLNANFISVDFDNKEEIPLGLERDFEVGDRNRYRVEPNYQYDKWSDGLEMELDIMKNPCKYSTYEELIFSKKEISDIARWTTSSHFPEWIIFEYNEGAESEATRYYGYFTNIETFVAGRNVYGLKLTFKCTTPFGYTDEIVESRSVTSVDNFILTNNSDELNSYIYPKIEINPHSDGYIYILNLSDCTTLTSGTLSLSATQISYADSLLDTVEQYAKNNGYTVTYTGKGAFNIELICNNTAVQFTLTDSFGGEKKCTAYYLTDSKAYYIIENGFMYMQVYKDLIVNMDCAKLTINDELGRMITYDKLGINDVDFMYWFKLAYGNNSIQLYGDADFTFKYMESKKVGE